jgi:hypothetical protein
MKLKPRKRVKQYIYFVTYSISIPTGLQIGHLDVTMTHEINAREHLNTVRELIAEVNHTDETKVILTNFPHLMRVDKVASLR